MKDDHFTQAQKISIIAAFHSLGLYDEIVPPKKNYDVVFLMGSLEQDVRSRLAFLIKCWHNGIRFPRIYILTGHRVLFRVHALE